MLPTVVAGILLALTAGCARQPETAAPVSSAAWDAYVNDFVAASFKAQPMFAVQSGRHEFDGRMPDLSRAGIQTEITRLQQARSAALQMDAATMSAAQNFERDYLISVIDDDLFWMAKAEFPFRNPAWYVGQLDPEVYLSREYAPLAQRLPGYIGYASSIPAIVADIRANLRTPLPKSFVEYAVKAFGGFAEFYRNDVPKVFAAVKDAGLQQQLAAANGAAIKAMSELRDWFVAQRRTADDSYPLGPALFAAMLRETEGITLPIAQIKAAGEADVARNTAALKEACAQLAAGKSLADCVASEEARKPPGGPVAAGRAELASLRQFVLDAGLVTIPDDEQPQVQEAPPYNRGNAAYIIIPGFYEKNVASVYSISPPDPAWSKAEQLAYIDGEARQINTTIHEVWPGHFLQFLHSNRSRSIIGRLWVGYAFAEGWAHYGEELMWDAGFGNGNPANHVAQLKDALWRDVRLLSAIGLHTEGMTVAQSEKMFREVAFDDPGNARQQAARGTYDPAYLNYTLGKLAIRKLRDDWIARRLAGKSGVDPRTEWRAFHDQFLSYGGPPIPLVRRAMLADDGGSLL
jgi:uncharacterized protein (DUF885 family)